MAISSARAYYGLQGVFNLSSVSTSGTAVVGPGSTAMTLPADGQVWAVQIEVDGSGSVTVATDSAGTPTISGAGTAQVETATAAGTIGTTGNATVIVTGDDITGSPLTVSVAVTSGDTAATWAGKVRTALNATAAITSLYTVGGSTTAISLTRITPRKNDGTLNISLANGTCTGITAAPTSADTTAGDAPSTCVRLPGVTFSEDDAEGGALANQDPVACLIMVDSSTVNVIEIEGLASGTDVVQMRSGEILLKAGSADIIGIGNLTFTSLGTYAKCTLVVVTQQP